MTDLRSALSLYDPELAVRTLKGRPDLARLRNVGLEYMAMDSKFLLFGNMRAATKG